MQFILRGLILLSIIIAKGHADEAKPVAKPLSAITKENSKISVKEAKLPVKPLAEMSMGRTNAPVVMLNYSSLTCGHCAQFHTIVLPQIEEKYIKPGYVRIIFRDYPGDQISLKAHQLAWCKGEIKYLDFVKLLYTTQEKWLLASDPVAALKSIALQNGITAKQFEACLKNQELMDKIIQVRLEGQKKYNITATPTLVINAKIYPHALNFEEFEKIVRPLLVSATEKGKKPTLDKVKASTLGKNKESFLEKVKEPTIEKAKEPTEEKVKGPAIEKIKEPTEEKTKEPTLANEKQNKS